MMMISVLMIGNWDSYFDRRGGDQKFDLIRIVLQKIMYSSVLHTDIEEGLGLRLGCELRSGLGSG